MAIGACPECGMIRGDWPNLSGYEVAGLVYCCQGCADGSGCTCQVANPCASVQNDEESSAK